MGEVGVGEQGVLWGIRRFLWGLAGEESGGYEVARGKGPGEGL